MSPSSFKPRRRWVEFSGQAWAATSLFRKQNKRMGYEGVTFPLSSPRRSLRGRLFHGYGLGPTLIPEACLRKGQVV